MSSMETDTVRAEHQASAGRRSLELHGDQAEQQSSIEHTICTISSGYRDNLYARQPLTIQRAVARYVDCPNNNSSDQIVTNKYPGPETELDQAEKERAEHQVEPEKLPPTSGQAEQECSQEMLRDGKGQAEKGRAEHSVQPEKLPPPTSGQAEQECSQELLRDGTGQAEKGRAEHLMQPEKLSPTPGQAEHLVQPSKPRLKQRIGQAEQKCNGGDSPDTNRAEQQRSEEKGTDQAEQMAHPDPYVKAWLEWKERYEKEGKEKAERLEKQKRLEKGWNLVKLCGEIIRENYDGWQEREITEMEKKELLDLKLEKEARLERQKRKKEEFKEGRKVMSKEEMFLRKIELAEIKENAWKWRGSTSSHEEHARRQEKGKKTAEKEKTLEKVRKRMRKEEEEEMTRKKFFLERWKEKEERKRRQKTAEEGWKNLMNSISEWEEMILDDSSEEEVPEMELMTEEWFRVAGRIMEGILEEVIAFTELDEKFGVTVTTNNTLHLNLSQNNQSKPDIQLREGKISADADGGPRSRVRTAGHSAQPPIDVSGNFSAHVSAE